MSWFFLVLVRFLLPSEPEPPPHKPVLSINVCLLNLELELKLEPEPELEPELNIELELELELEPRAGCFLTPRISLNIGSSFIALSYSFIFNCILVIQSSSWLSIVGNIKSNNIKTITINKYIIASKRCRITIMTTMTPTR